MWYVGINLFTLFNFFKRSGGRLRTYLQQCTLYSVQCTPSICILGHVYTKMKKAKGALQIKKKVEFQSFLRIIFFH